MRFRGKIAFILMPLAVVAAIEYNHLYSEAYGLLEAGKTSEARNKFQIVLEAPEESGLLDNAEYWIANSYLDDKNFYEAVRHYKRAQLLPDGNKHAAAQFELAKALSMAGDTIKAVIEYYKVLSIYPNDDLTARALARIDALGDPTRRSNEASNLATQVNTQKAQASSEQKTEADTEPRVTTQETQESTEKKETPPEQKVVDETQTPQPEAEKGTSAQTSTAIEPSGTEQSDKGTAPSPSEAVQNRPETSKNDTTGTPEARNINSYAALDTSNEYAEQSPDTSEFNSNNKQWDAPSPVKREDGILTLPLHADPRILILPKDRQGF
ncbi:tetratricopeptide repeat protein [bacterium]|nr:tetratricopeptide repeat protein [bacterium]